MNAEYRALAGTVATVLAVGVVSSVLCIPAPLAAAGLIVAGLARLAVLLTGRERRIRARLADPRARTARTFRDRVHAVAPAGVA